MTTPTFSLSRIRGHAYQDIVTRTFQSAFGKRTRTRVYVRVVQALPFQTIRLGGFTGFEDYTTIEVDGEGTRSQDSELHTSNILIDEPTSYRTIDAVDCDIEHDENRNVVTTIVHDQRRGVGTTDIRIAGKSLGIPGEYMERPPSSIQTTNDSVTITLSPGGFFGRQGTGSIVGGGIGGVVGGLVLGIERLVSVIRPMTTVVRPILVQAAPGILNLFALSPQGRVLSIIGAIAGGAFIGTDIGAWVGQQVGRAYVWGPSASVTIEISNLASGRPRIVLRDTRATRWPDLHIQILVLTEDEAISFTGLVSTIVQENDYPNPPVWNEVLSRGEQPVEFQNYNYLVIPRAEFDRIVTGRRLIRSQDIPGTVSKSLTD